MSDCMHFPDTVEEFMEQYKMTDTKQVYSNGTEYVPIFRMKQWFEHEKAQLSQEGATKDAISKTETVEHLRRVLEATVPNTDYDEGFVDGVEFGVSTVSTMPTIQPQSTTGQLNDGARSTARSTDLIDRGQAIDAINHICPVDTEYDCTLLDRVDVRCVLSDLPSVRPVATDTNVGDTISRQAAIETAKDWYEGLICGSVNGLIKRLNALPTVQPEPPWILCDERMPEEHEWIGTKKFGTTISDEVYVTFENEKGERFCQHMKFQNGELSRYDQFHMDTWFKGSKPIAWMPLPEPYQKGANI